MSQKHKTFLTLLGLTVPGILSGLFLSWTLGIFLLIVPLLVLALFVSQLSKGEGKKMSFGKTEARIITDEDPAE